MNEIVNTFLLVDDEFMLEVHLKQPGFTYSACSPFTKNKVGIETSMQTENTDHIYKNDLHKACFQHDMAYGKFKDPAKRIQSDEVLRHNAFKIASTLKYEGYQRGLASMVYKFFDKKSTGAGIKSMLNQQLANELYKPIIRNLKKRKVYFLFKDNIADMQLITKYNKGIRYLLCTIDLFSKICMGCSYKRQKRSYIVNTSQKLLNSSKRKTNKIWVDQGSEFCKFF